MNKFGNFICVTIYVTTTGLPGISFYVVLALCWIFLLCYVLPSSKFSFAAFRFSSSAFDINETKDLGLLQSRLFFLFV